MVIATLGGEEHGWRTVSQDGSGSGVELVSDGLQVGRGVDRQVGSLREVLTQQTVRILVATALPGRVRVREVDLRAECLGDLRVPGHLRSLVPGD